MTTACLPALRVTPSPTVRVPAGACDCHFHIFGSEQEFPFSLPRDYTPPLASIADYRAMAAMLGLQRMVIVQPSVYGTDNSCTLQALAAFGRERARAVVVLDANISDRDLRALDDAGVRGVRFNLVNAGGLPHDLLTRFAARIADLGWHIQVYLNGPQLLSLKPLLSGLPTPLVIDHMGQIRIDSPSYAEETDALCALLSTGRAWVKLCGYRASTTIYPYDDVLPLARRLIATAPDRCVWGTDWPHPGLYEAMPDDASLLDLLAAWAPDANLLARILVTNPAELYRF